MSERKFVCRNPDCMERFKYRSTRLSHERKIHEEAFKIQAAKKPEYGGVSAEVQESEGNFGCRATDCMETFKHRSTRITHEKKFHETSEIRTDKTVSGVSQESFSCRALGCGKTFKHRSTRISHEKKCHKKSEIVPSKPMSGRLCGLCGERLKDIFSLCSHVENSHGIPSGIITREFDSELEFYVWKSEIHRTSDTEFCTAKSQKDCGRKLFLCHRTGTYQPIGGKTVNSRAPRETPTIKLGFDCTAFISLKQVDGKFLATACLNHYGHSMDPRLLHWNDSTQAKVVKMLTKDRNPPVDVHVKPVVKDNYYLGQMHKRHRTSMKMDPTSIEPHIVDRNGMTISWSVPSLHDPMTFHIVTQQSFQCDCNVRCRYCGVCPENYSCDCVSSERARPTACEHIHLVHTTEFKRVEHPPNLLPEVTETYFHGVADQMIPNFYTHPVPKPFEDSTSRISAKVVFALKKLLNAVESGEVRDKTVLNMALEKVNQVNSLIETVDRSGAFKTPKKDGPMQNFDHYGTPNAEGSLRMHLRDHYKGKVNETNDRFPNQAPIKVSSLRRSDHQGLIKRRKVEKQSLDEAFDEETRMASREIVEALSLLGSR